MDMVELSITSRIKQILEMICDASGSITVKNIAKKIGVSTRTILREMPTVEKWLENNAFELIKKPRIGIKLRASLEDKKRLKSLLDRERIEKIYTPKERQLLILSELLERKEPVKFFYFSHLIKVSEGTISHDLDKIEEWGARHKLTLVRKPGLGVYLTGDEEDFRRATINLLYEHFDETQMLYNMRQSLTTQGKIKDSIEINTKNKLMNLIDKEIIKIIETIINKVEGDLEYTLTDSSYAGLIIHIALALQRIKNNENIKMNDDILWELKNSEEYKIAENIADQIAEFIGIEIPLDEVGYITMHLKGSKMRNGANRNDFKDIDEFMIDNFELTKLVNKMIKIAESESGYALQHNENLLVGLVTHLRPTIDRLKMNLDIRNPLLSKIKETYPKIFEISKKSAEVINERFNFRMPESELGFIAMHIGAAIEKNMLDQSAAKRIYHVIVACTSGIGTSKILAARLKKEFEHLKIVDTVSTLQIKKHWLEENKIDLVISTVYVEEYIIPCVKVNPLLLKEDIVRIQEALGEIVTNSKQTYHHNKELKLDLKERACALKGYSEGILEVLDSFFFKDRIKIENIKALIRYVSGLVGDEFHNIDIIEKDLVKREKNGSTVLSDEGIMLLHCRTDGVQSLKFGVLRLSPNKPINYLSNGKEERINIALIMVAPIDTDKRHLEVISEISKNLIENDNFVDTLVQGSNENIYKEVNGILNRFLNSKINERQEDFNVL